MLMIFRKNLKVEKKEYVNDFLKKF